MAIFPTFFFSGNFSQEKVFYDILEGVNAFLGFEKKKFKNWKINIFSKELTHAFGPKMAIFPTLFFRQYREGKCILRYSRTKNASLGYKKKCKKSENSHFSKGVNACFWSKNRHFSKFIFQTIYARKMSFTILQNEKTPFQGLTHAFGPKMAFFIELFFPAIQARKMSFTIFQNERTPPQAIKKSLKSQKIDFFPKGLTHPFGPKMAIFPTFFFREYRPGKCLLRYSRRKRRLSRP